MKLLRYGPMGAEKPGLLDADGTIRDLSGVVGDIGGATLSDEGLDRLRRLDAGALPEVDPGVRLGPCVAGIGKFVCIGLNYSDHAAETGATVPPEPIIFMKATSAICGPNDPVIIPRGSQKTDWEVELAVVIGKRAKYVAEADALGYVAGYCVANDVSRARLPDRAAGAVDQGQVGRPLRADRAVARHPRRGGRPAGAADVADGERRDAAGRLDARRWSTASRYLVSYLSQFMSLDPGDIISTGTPPGVGMGMKPPTLPQGRRRDRARHRGARRAAAGLHRRPGLTAMVPLLDTHQHLIYPDRPALRLDRGRAGARRPGVHARGLPAR